MITHQLSEDRISFTERRNMIIGGLHALPAQIKKVLELGALFQELAETIHKNKSSLIVGCRYRYVNTFVPNCHH